MPPVDPAAPTVGVTADRRGEDQALLLRRLGLNVLHAPMLRTEREPVDADLRRATERLIAAPPDYLVANTGFGIRSWWERATEWGLAEELTAALAETKVAARGPKAAGAIRMLGLPVWWRSPSEQLDSVTDHLLAAGVAGKRVAFQLHGDDRQTLSRRLTEAGATVDEVPVYRWSTPVDEQPALDLVRGCIEGRVAAVTFTAGPAVRHFVGLADAAGLAGPLLDALNGPVVVVCVGPVCAGVAEEEGIRDALVPEHWRLGSMVNLVGTALGVRGAEKSDEPSASPDGLGPAAYGGRRG
jgi:uroporphyrinogen-III synthase